MVTEKPKRKRRPQSKSTIRFILILVMIVPVFFVARHPGIGDSLLTDGIAISVLICSAVYVLHQLALWLIAAYMGILSDDNTSDYDIPSS